MAISRTARVALSVLAGGAAAVMIAVVGATPASAHGYTTNPASRAANCANGVVSDCGQIQYEPQSVEGPKGFPGGGPQNICSADNASFSELDDPRGGEWPAQNVSSGQTLSFNWTLTAAHSTTAFEYYITNSGYDPGQPLTRGALDTTPFLTVPYDGQQPPTSVSHSGTLPDRSGKHMIVGVWTIADTANAFYQCSDVNFG